MQCVDNTVCKAMDPQRTSYIVNAELSALQTPLDPEGTTLRWVRRTEQVSPNQTQLASEFGSTPHVNDLHNTADIVVALINTGMSSEGFEQESQSQQPETQQPKGDAKEPTSSRDSVKLVYDTEPQSFNFENKLQESSDFSEKHENINGDTQTKVRTSVSETKEVSHKVFKAFVSDSQDTLGFIMPEYSNPPFTRDKTPFSGQAEVLRAFSTDHIEQIPRSNQEEIKTHTVQRHERRYIPVTKISSSKAESKSNFSETVSKQEYDDMKKQYEVEVAYWKRMCNEIHNGSDQLLSNEPMRRHIVNLESELRDSKTVSETVSLELQTLRKEYETLVQKVAELESAKRHADIRCREHKSNSKRLQTELQEKNTLIEKLRETYSKDKRTQYLFEEMKAEHTRLARDYEILRQTFNQKEQQIQSMLMERTEMQRKLDALECERRQLEHRLYSQPASSRVLKQADTNIPVDICRADDEPVTVHSETSKSTITLQQTLPSPPGWKYEVDESVIKTEEIDSTTETIGREHTEESGHAEEHLGLVNLAAQSDKTSREQQPKESTTVTRITVRPRRPDPMPDLPRGSPSRAHKVLSGLDSFGESMTDSMRHDDERQHYYHSSRYESNTVRKIGDTYSPRPTRPSTAYGHFTSTLDRDTYRSPLPPRSTTSFGRFPTMDYTFRSPERRSPSRKPRFYFSYAPEAFKYEVIRPSRMELLGLEEQLVRLKREKRRLGKQLSRYSSRVYPQPEDIYSGLLRLDQEIRVLESRLNSLRGTR